MKVSHAWLRASLPIAFAAATLLRAPLGATDCNSNGTDDLADISSGVSRDCNANTVPDECELSPGKIAYEARGSLSAGQASTLIAQDFDGDGEPDIALTELSGPQWQEGQARSPSVVYFRNGGHGQFDVPVRYALTGAPYTMYTRDLDGDHDSDLLCVLGDTASVAVLLNRGNGAFDGPVTYPVGASPMGRCREITADLDGDHDLDLVTSNMSSNDLSILINRGDGTFSPGSSVPVVRPYYFIFFDADSDGDVDIALDTYNTQTETDPGHVVILKNDGAGAFPEREDVELGKWMQELDSADLDGDGDFDLVVTQSRPRLLAVLTNRGDGRFDIAPSLDPHHVPGQNQPEHVLLADIDGDGDADALAGADGLGGTREAITVFSNDGHGAFAAGVPYLAGDEPERIEVRDLDGDGRPELIALNSFSGDLSVMKNLGGGAFEAASQFPIGDGAWCLQVVDFDSDGDLDVISTGFKGTRPGVIFLENVSGGSFAGGSGCTEFRRGDANSDGEVSLADLITIRRYLFAGGEAPACLDAADATDNDVVSICDAVKILNVLFRNPGWSDRLPAPSPNAAQDPTPMADESDPCDLNSNGRPTRPLACESYEVTAPVPTEDILRIGDAQGAPGGVARLPVHLTTSVPVEAIQIVLAYDPDVLEPVAEEADGISFEGAYLERFQSPFGFLASQPEHRVLVVGMAGNLILPGSAIEPGDDILVGWINVRVKPGAAVSEVEIEPTNGPDELGVGAYRLRNEITHRGAAKLVSFLPKTAGGRFGIVGDQSLFIRGDANGDNKLDVSDPITSLAALFLGGTQIGCTDAADSNDDGALDLADAVFTLGYLFQGLTRPPAPFPAPGIDPTDDSLVCAPPAGRQ